MAQTEANFTADRGRLRGIKNISPSHDEDRFLTCDSSLDQPCDSSLDQHKTPAATGKAFEYPRRPNSRVLSDTIPFLFIGRNSRGLWVVREAEGRTGGIFLFKKSALHFAARASAPIGYGTMLLHQRLELDVDNRGNPVVAWLDRTLGGVAGLIPAFFRQFLSGKKTSLSA
jgi:hypothetical protein